VDKENEICCFALIKCKLTQPCIRKESGFKFYMAKASLCSYNKLEKTWRKNDTERCQKYMAKKELKKLELSLRSENEVLRYYPKNFRFKQSKGKQ